MCDNDATIVISETLEPTTVIISDDCTDVTVLINDTIENVTIEVCALGEQGLSAYQIAVANGFVGTEQEWLDSLTPEVIKHKVKLDEAIAKGQAVYISGANGANILVKKASNTSEATSSKTLGLLETGGALNAQVNVVTEGLLEGLDTSSATIGDAVWLGVSGNLIFGLTNKPHAPAHLVYLGVVARVNANNGSIFVHPQNGFELEELHNVLIENKANKQTIIYDATTSLWKNGYTWEYLAINAKTDGAENTITNGYYLNYDLQGVSIYRYITTATDANGYPNEDSFYATNTAGVLTNLIVTRE